MNVPRDANDEPGSAYSEFYLVSTKTGEVKPFITGKVNVRAPQWSPDGKSTAFLMARGKGAYTQVWRIPVDGGEAFPITKSETGVSFFRWHPGGNQIGYLATTPKTDHEKELEKRGYGFILYEENWKQRNLYLAPASGEGKTRQGTEGVTLWSFEFCPDGKKVAAGISPKNLIDHRYVFQKVYIFDLMTGKKRQLTDNPGKLGNYAFSPDGKNLV